MSGTGLDVALVGRGDGAGPGSTGRPGSDRPMASMFDRFTQFANDPKTRAKLDDLRVKAQQAVNDPRTRAKLDQLRQRAHDVANDPRTRAKIDQARRRAEEFARDPKTRARIDEARHRFFGKGSGRAH